MTDTPNALPPISRLLAIHHGMPEKEGLREMLPAMTREEWEHMVGHMAQIHAPGSNAHAQVARALIGQPFGFDPEDVALLGRLFAAGPMCETENEEDALRRDNLAARIAALLPPPTP